MIQINIREVPFYVINLEEDTDKRTYLAGQLEELGVTYHFINAIRAEPGSIGITLSHLKILSMESLKVPFVILEDDCRFFFDRIPMQFTLPDKTDGFYLGHSSFGVRPADQFGVQWSQQGGAKYDILDAQYLRIRAMLALHGLLYVSERLHENAIAANWKALLHYDFYHSGDISYAQLQKNHLMLAPHLPWCYQSEIFGGNWGATKRSILKTCPQVS